MRKILCLFFTVVFVFSSLNVSAEDFSFDIYDGFYRESSDETVLMEVSEDIKIEFEKRLTKAWENMETSVKLYPDIKIHKDDIVSLMTRVFYENPKYYYVKRSFSYTKDSDGYLGEVNRLQYNISDKDEIEETWGEIDKAAEEIMLYITPDMTDFEKIMTVHDYMVLNYTYDIHDMDQTYLIMLDKVGVCAAYASAFQYMMNTLGIESTLVQSKEMGHIWNLVKLDGEWYHVDVTWDDPIPDQFGRVSHEHIFLSEAVITEKGHTGFSTPYAANSTKYDDAPWRNSDSAIVTVDGVMYRVEENNLIDETGAVIYEDLDGGDGKWSVTLTSYVENVIWAGLCEINGILYFNTDTGIYSYNPETGETACVLEAYGIGGLFAERNIIFYNEYDFEEGLFVKKGEIKVGDVRFTKPYYEEGKVIARAYNDCDVPLWLISKGDGYMVHKIDAKSTGKAEFENGEEQMIYIWKNSLEPVNGPFVVTE